MISKRAGEGRGAKIAGRRAKRNYVSKLVAEKDREKGRTERAKKSEAEDHFSQIKSRISVAILLLLNLWPSYFCLCLSILLPAQGI